MSHLSHRQLNTPPFARPERSSQSEVEGCCEQKLLTLSPAQLWLGASAQLAPTLLAYLYQQLNKPEATIDPGLTLDQPKLTPAPLALLKQLAHLQHHSLLVVQPTAGYTVELLAPVLAQLRLTLATNQRFLIILPQADQLSPACANLLLKALEEPPTGYHFILLAQRFYQVLPTLRSRCQISYFYETPASTDQLTTDLIKTFQQQLDPASLELDQASTELFQLLTKQIPGSWEQFLQLTNKLNLSDHASQTLLDQVIVYWSELYKTRLTQQLLTTQQVKHLTPLTNVNAGMPATTATSKTTVPVNQLNQCDTDQLNQLAQLIDTLHQTLLYPPVRGSQKICWRSIYLALYN